MIIDPNFNLFPKKWIYIEGIISVGNLVERIKGALKEETKEFCHVEDFVIEDSTDNIDTVLIDTDKSDAVKMVEPGFVGWVNYGGSYRPAKVIS